MMKNKKYVPMIAMSLSLILSVSPMVSGMDIDQVRELLNATYIDPIPEEILQLPTIDEITNAIGDPFTYYMSPQEQSDFTSSLNDTSIVGIGTMIEKLTEGLKVILFSEKSPAQEAGMEVGDLVVWADGVSIDDVESPDDLASFVVGEEGTTVDIGFYRDGVYMELSIIRRGVTFPTAYGELLDGRIGWLTVETFGENTGEYFYNFIKDVERETSHWVVDLRGNPGGYGRATVMALGYAFGTKNMAYLLDKNGKAEIWNPLTLVGSDGDLIDEPVIVVVDNQSASGAELFAGAVRDYQVGLVVGERTYGKGLSQQIYLDEDGASLKVTTQRYYSPNKLTPDRTGILPDLVVDGVWAGHVAHLLSGEPSKDAWMIRLGDLVWYVDKALATSEDYGPATAQLLGAIGPETVMYLDGNVVTAQDVSSAWGIEYQNPYFSDVTESPYEKEINTLSTLGLVKGDEQGNFNPENLLTRAEMANFLVQSMGFWNWTSQSGDGFTDVDESDWYYPSAMILESFGFMVGDEQGKFNGSDLVTHEQLVTILMRAGSFVSIAVDFYAEKAENQLQDTDTMVVGSAWAKAWIYGASELITDVSDGDGILLTALEDFQPTEVVTREQAAALIYNLMVYSQLIDG